MKRTYAKVFNLMGELGGFIEIVLVIIGGLYGLSKVESEKQRILKVFLGDLYSQERKFTSDKKPLNAKELDRLNEIEDEIIEESQDGLQLQKNILQIGVINDMIFKDYHKALIPYLVKKQAEKRLSDQKLIQFSKEFASLLTENQQRNIDLDQQKLYVKKELAKEMSGSEAFEKLWSSEPSSDFEKAVKNYFLANLPDSVSKLGDEKSFSFNSPIQGIPRDKPELASFYPVIPNTPNSVLFQFSRLNKDSEGTAEKQRDDFQR